MIGRAVRYWVQIWDLKEHPRSLAAIRICLGFVLLFDAMEVLRRGLVVPLMGTIEAGGLGPALTRGAVPLWYQVFPPDPSSAWLMWAVLATSALCFMLGCFPRIAAVTFVLVSAQWSQVLPQSDRVIDTLLRNVMLIMVFSDCGRTLSMSAWWKTGSWHGDGQDVPAWPRHLIILQLVLMYFMAGVQKFGITWWPWGHCRNGAYWRWSG